MKIMKKYIVSVAAALFAFGAFAQVQHNLVIVDKDGSRTEINRDNIKGITFAEMPEYYDVNNLLSAVYSTTGDLASYEVVLSNATPNASGQPAAAGDFQVVLVLTGEPSADADNAILPAGYYRMGNGSSAGTFNFNKSMLLVYSEDSGSRVNAFIDGTVDVRHNGDNYDIRCELDLFTGEALNARFTGPIQFAKGSTEQSPFDTPQQIAFDGGQGRFYGNWFYPFADDGRVQFYQGEFDSSNTLVEGYWLDIDIYMPKSDDPMNVTTIPDGVYSVEPREAVSDCTNLPYTFIGGSEADFMGEPIVVGSTLTYKSKTGDSKFGMITGGTITVSNSGKQFKFDLLTDNGISITGSCTGMNLGNYCDNDLAEPARPYSTLTADYALSFPSDAVGGAWSLGDFIKEGLNVYYLQIAEPTFEKGDYVALELLSADSKITDGVYKVGNTLDDKSCLVGCYASNKVDIQFSWCGNLEKKDADGYNEIMAPINGGTITVKTGTDGKQTFTLDLQDDNGHKITGSWTGTVSYQSASAAGQLKKKAPSGAAPDKVEEVYVPTFQKMTR